MCTCHSVISGSIPQAQHRRFFIDANEIYATYLLLDYEI